MSKRPMFPKPDEARPFSGPFAQVGEGTPTAFSSGFLREGLVEHYDQTPADPQSQALNTVEMRVKTVLNERLRQRAPSYLAPMPLHDFTNDDASCSEDFDQASDYYALTGVGGKRLLRAKDQIPPQAGCETDEELWKRDQPLEPLPFARHDAQCEEVYRSTFQDLSPETPESVMQQLETHPDPQMAMRPFYTPTDKKDETLVFESRFESGNLYSASKVGSHEYDLVLQNDTNTSGHTQWYFFSVSNTRIDRSYKFNVINLMKHESLYNSGLRPLLLSTKGKETSELVWRRVGSQIRYYNNAQKRRGVFQSQADPYWTLSFTVTFEHNEDTCYLAHCYPYTYRDLQVYLHEIGRNPDRRKYVRRKRLCDTEAGNACDLLTVTAGKEGKTELESRKGVVITARVHPGETQASWMAEGLLDFLSSEDPQAAELRGKYIFKIVPMLNPDGVINGNYRCCLAGNDLNRRWDRPNSKHHSTVAATKLMMVQFMKEHEVVLFLDLHGHSNKKDVFTYGNDQRAISEKFPASTLPHGGQHERLSERVFPYILQECVPGFSYSKCSFKVQRAKLSTGRVVCAREFGLVNAYTLEASFSGASETEMHFDIPQLQMMGRGICLAVLACFSPDTTLRDSVLEKLHAIESGVYSEEENSEDSSSADEGDETEGPKTSSSQERGSGKDKRSVSPEHEGEADRKGRRNSCQERDGLGKARKASRDGLDGATRSTHSSFNGEEGGQGLQTFARESCEGKQQSGVDTKASRGSCAGKGGPGVKRRPLRRGASQESAEDEEDFKEFEILESGDTAEGARGVGDTPLPYDSSRQAMGQLLDSGGVNAGTKAPERRDSDVSKARADNGSDQDGEGLPLPPTRRPSAGPSGETTPSSRRPLSGRPNLRKGWAGASPLSTDSPSRKAGKRNRIAADGGGGAEADALRPVAAKGHRFHVKRGALTARVMSSGRADDGSLEDPLVPPVRGDSLRKGLRAKRRGGLGKRCKSVDSDMAHTATTAAIIAGAPERETAQDGEGNGCEAATRSSVVEMGYEQDKGSSEELLKLPNCRGDLRLGCKSRTDKPRSEVQLLEKLRAAQARLAALSQASSRIPRLHLSLVIHRNNKKEPAEPPEIPFTATSSL